MMPASFAQALAHGSSEALLSLSPTGRVLSWSRTAELLLGHLRADVVGRPLISLALAPEDVDRFQETLRHAVDHGEARARLRLRSRDGTLLDDALPLRVRREEAGASLVLFVGREAPDAPAVAAVAPPAPPAGAQVPPGSLAEMSRRIHRVLSSSHGESVMAVGLARILAPALGDWCALDIANDAGQLERIAAAHADPSREDILRELSRVPPRERGPADPERAFRLCRAIRDADDPLGDEAAPEEDAWRQGLRRVGASSYLVLPLVGRLRPVGAITLARGAGRAPLSVAEREWLEDVGRRFALEVENARLATRVQRLAEEARLASERASLLQGLAAAISEALTPREVVHVAVEQCKRAMGACGGAVALLRDAVFEVVGTVGPAEVLSDAWRRFPVHARYPLSDAGRSGEIVIVDHLPSAAARYPHLASPPAGIGALAAVPLFVDGRRSGVLGLTFPDRRAFSEADRAFMRTIARVTADALERARLYDAERSARALASTEAARSNLLAEVSRMLSASFDYDSTLPDVARLVVPSLADWCAVHVRDKDGPLRTLVVVHADPARAHDASAMRDVPPGPRDRHIATVLATGEPQIFQDLPPDVAATLSANPRRGELMGRLGVRSLMVLPLVSRGKTLGAVVLAHAGIRRFQSGDLPLGEELARRIAMGIDNARLFRAAQESEERARLLIEGVQDHALVMLDDAGRIASWNAGAQRLLGHVAEDALGTNVETLYATDDARTGRAAAHLAAARSSGRCEDETWIARRGGDRFLASLVLTAVRDGAGLNRGYSLLLRDLTEPRKAREALEHLRQQVVMSEKLSTMGTLVSGVAHEIRTPLTAMSNSLYGLRMRLGRMKGAPLDDGALELVSSRIDAALEGVDRINRLVEDLRRFHRLPETPRAPVGLNDVVQEALNLFRAAHRGRVEVEARLAPTYPCAVDRIQVQQAVLNLLQNASEAMPHGGRVVIETRNEGAAATITVRDEGVGMAPDVRAHMFEEFFTTKRDGTGLGLSIVRRIVETHNATIECESEKGAGTTFVLRFPGPDETG